SSGSSAVRSPPVPGLPMPRPPQCRPSGFFPPPVENRTVAVEYRFASGKNALFPRLAADLVERNVAVIQTTSPSSWRLRGAHSQGGKPGGLTVAQPTKYDLVVNTKTAKLSAGPCRRGVAGELI